MDHKSGVLKWVLLGGGLLMGGYLLYDYLVVTDQERLEAFAEMIEGEFTPDKAQAGYEWVDPERLPITVDALGVNRTYRTETEFRSEASRGVSRFYGDNIRVLSSRVEVVEDRGTINMRIMSERAGGRLAFELTKLGEDWLIHKVRVSR